MALSKPVTWAIGVGRALDDGIGAWAEVGTDRLDRRKRARSHAAACRRVETFGALTLQRGNAERVDRRFGNDKPRHRNQTSAEQEESFVAAFQRALKLRSTDLDMRDPTFVAVGEPRTAVRAIPNDVLLTGREQDIRREVALFEEIAPSGATGAQARPSCPTLGHGTVSPLPFPRALRRLVARRDADEFSQHLADMTKVEARIEVLDQGEDVALWLRSSGPTSRGRHG